MRSKLLPIVFGVALVMIIIVFVLDADQKYENDKFEKKLDIVKNATGTYLLKDTDQLLPTCPEGTNYALINEDISCRVDIENPPLLSDTIGLMIGIAIAAVATAAGLILTMFDRKDAAKQRNQEIVQIYSEELRDISNQELNLKTKQECALYAEQYLDTVEKIATLNKMKIFSDDTMKYFENNFTYAIDLWWWYNLNVHGIDDDTQEEIWKIAEEDSLDAAGFLKEYGIPERKKDDDGNYLHPIEIKDFISEKKLNKMNVKEKEEAEKELKTNLQILAPEDKAVLRELWYKVNLKSVPEDYFFFGVHGSGPFFNEVNIRYLGPEEQIILKTVEKGDIDTVSKEGIDTVSKEGIDTISKGSIDTDLEYFFDKDQIRNINSIEGRKNKLKKKIQIFDRFMAFYNYFDQDRWPDLRNYMRSSKFTEFAYNFRGVGGKDNSEKNWRVLPDMMYYDYKNIPDEDGLSKSEFVEIIRPYADVLSKFVEQEKSNTEPEQFEVYAEQYLETLEQIATLYRRKIIPTKASEYFENKFTYGCNLWDWYHDIVLKFSDELDHALWATSTDIKLEDIYSKKILSAMSDKEKQQKKDTEFDKKTFEEFLKSYSNNGLTDPFDKFIKEDPDIWKLIELAADKDIKRATSEPDKLKKLNLKTKAAAHREECKVFIEFIEGDKANDLAEKLSKLKKSLGDKYPTPQQEKKIETAIEDLAKAKYAIKAAIREQDGQTAGFINKDTDEEFLDENQKPSFPVTIETLSQVFGTLPQASGEGSSPKTFSEKMEKYAEKYYDSSLIQLMRLFVINYLDNERWEDFRWWCKNTENGKKEITPFQDDKDEGLILPLKMWDAYYP